MKSMIYKMALAGAICGGACGFAGDASGVSPMEYRAQMSQKETAPTPSCPVDCSALPAQQKDFAMKLSPLHRGLFCQQFTQEQRMQAMGLITASQGGQAMTPDEAVEEVMKNSRGVTQPNQQRKNMTNSQKNPNGQKNAPQKPANIY